MLLFAVFCVAAAMVALAPRLAVWRERRLGGPRPEGIVLVGAVLLSALLGLLLYGKFSASAVSSASVLSLLLTGALYALSAARGALRLPPWIADILLLGAAAAAIYLLGQPVIKGLGLPFTDRYVGLGPWAAPLTVLWMWVIARMTATLNRTPLVTGGYFGIVALTLLLCQVTTLVPSAAGTPFFPKVASAALAGAGLASLPIALRYPNFNIGWSATLAMGFLLAQISVVGLFKNVAFTILALMLLVFGLPLLDVSFYRVRAARRGKNVSREESRLRLHKALIERGISPAKVSLLYLAIAAYLCILGVLFVVLGHWNVLLRTVLTVVLLLAGSLVFFSVARVLMRRVEGEEIPEEVEAFGVRISPVSMSEALDKMEEFIQSRQPHHVVTSDANAILRAQEDEEYAGIIRRAALITPDGYGVMWGARLLNLPIYERVTGVDMVTGICERAAKKGYSIYILGSSPGVAATAAQKLSERFPGLTVAGTQHGYFKPEEEDAVVRQIHDAKPDVLFVAFGIPKQEKFIAKHFHELNVPVSLGVGGSFDVYSEKLKRAPEYIQRSGLEWLYRVWQEPARWKRMSYVPRFMAFALREWLFGPSSARRERRDSKTAL
jgi:N-acetylglucosaminyldiphosphoundecaprenol N-acetyl-beta-D-mannosaminyltransferase